MRILIKNGTLINPMGKISGDADILINGSSVEKIGKNINTAADKVIDAKGMHVFPAFNDMHCHLRDPGQEYKEDIISGTKAAVAGGFASVACMPNTVPVIDNAALISYIVNKADQSGYCKVYPIGAVTKGQDGSELAEMAAMIDVGAVAFSDDGHPVLNGRIMKNALLYAKSFGALIISHCEDLSIRGEGVMNEGYYSTILGLKGISASAEEAMVAREALLARDTDSKVHIAHISTKGSVEIIRLAKKNGISVTCETCPHYFSMDDSWVKSTDANTKVNPPLRSKEDVSAIIEGLKDGTIDAIATDHAPHHRDEKLIEYDMAAFGLSGLETAFSLAITNLYNKKALTLNEITMLLSYNPAKLLNVEGGTVEEGKSADITIGDLNESYILSEENMYSKGKNTPLIGKELTGRIKYTIVNGKIVFENGNIK
ncbi:MAG: dihydroorotase [Eubacteriales bacterium]